MMKKYAIALILATSAVAQTSALLPYPRQTPLNNSGDINVGGCVYTYSSGTTTPQATYSNAGLSIANTNPMVLDSSGRLPAIYWNGTAIKVVYANKVNGTCPSSPGTPLWSQDPVTDTGLALKTALAAVTGSGLIGFEPAGGTVPTTVSATLNSAFLYDIGYTTFALACSAAASNNKTLAVTKLWTSVPAQTVGCDLWFPSGAGGQVQPASGAAITMVQGKTVTAADFQIFDQSAGGTFRMLLSPTPGHLKWWGAKCDDSTDDAATIGYALAATSHLILPLGHCTSSTQQTLTVSGQKITGQGGGYVYASANTAFLFTGATNGFSAGNVSNVTLDSFAIATSNGGGLKAMVNTAATGAGWVFRDIHIIKNGGAWTHGFYTTAFESALYERPYCEGIAVCFSLNSQSNSIDIIAPLIIGTYATGIQVTGFSYGTRIFGGTIQGTYSDALVHQDGGISLIGTYLEGSGPSHIISTGSIRMTDVYNGGGTQTSDVFTQTGVDMMVITGLNGYSTLASGKCVVKYLGNAPGSGQGLTVTESYVQAVGAGSKGICIGSGAGGSWSGSITNNHLITTPGDAITLGTSSGGAYTITGNSIVSTGGYGINATALSDGKVKVDQNNFAFVSSGICTGCNYINSVPGINLTGNVTLNAFPGVGHIATLPACVAATEGLSYPVDDANSTTFNAAVAPAGTSHVSAYCDGTSWKTH